jgi:hypothetical protein
VSCVLLVVSSYSFACCVCACSFNRDDYEFNGLGRRGYVMRFPHPTPADVTVSLMPVTRGMWGVLALPYPAGTSFVVRRGTSLRNPAASVAALSSSLPWFHDTTAELLYLYMERVDVQRTTRFGLTWVTGSESLRVVATCPGGSCTTTGVATVPPALAATSARTFYTAQLACTAAVPVGDVARLCKFVARTVARAQLTSDNNFAVSLNHAHATGVVTVTLMTGSTVVATIGSTTPAYDEVMLTAANVAALNGGSLDAAVSVNGVIVMRGTFAAASPSYGVSRRRLRH